jgi:hypothetical protein
MRVLLVFMYMVVADTDGFAGRALPSLPQMVVRVFGIFHHARLLHDSDLCPQYLEIIYG